MVVATRPTSWRTLVSRSGVPRLPWKYLEATIFVAVIDQVLGTSTFFCSKMISPDSLVIAAVRYSHSTLSYGEIPSRVKYRRNSTPPDALVKCPLPPTFFSRTSSFITLHCTAIYCVVPQNYTICSPICPKAEWWELRMREGQFR